jgi:hypothetical protein
VLYIRKHITLNSTIYESKLDELPNQLHNLSKIQNFLRTWESGRYLEMVTLIASFHTFMAVKIQVEVFWAVTPCSVVVRYQHFRGPRCPHLQDETFVTYQNISRRRNPEDDLVKLIHDPAELKVSWCGIKSDTLISDLWDTKLHVMWVPVTAARSAFGLRIEDTASSEYI